MAYTLAKINIREVKTSVAIGAHTYNLIGGLVPITVGALSQIADSTTPGNDQWSFFPGEKELQINTTGVLSELYVDYALLTSNKNGAIYPLDPAGVGTSYKWEPYFKKAPQVVESAKNILESIITYNSLSIDLQSGEDNNVRKFLGSRFSVQNQDFKLWRISSTGTISSLYTGIGVGLNAKANSVSYKCNPKIKLLDEPAFYGLDVGFTNPWKQKGLTDQIPILCASILPYTSGFAQAPDNPNGSVLTSNQISWEGFEKSSLVKSQGFWYGSSLRVFHGITFSSFNGSDYSACAEPVTGSWPNVSTYTATEIAKVENITNLRQIGRCQKNGIATNPQTAWNKDRHPLDWGEFVGNKEIVFMKATKYSGGAAQDELTIYSSHNFTSESFNFADYTANTRFKHLYTTMQGYNQYIVNIGLAAGTSSTCQENPRMIPHTLASSITTHQSPTNDARMLEFSYPYGTSTSQLGGWVLDIDNEDAGDNNSFELFTHWQIPVGHASLSMENFIENTLEAAGLNHDLTELDYDESMQMVEKTDQSYRDILEKMLASIGFFIRYDSDANTAKFIKLDPATASSMDISESEFAGLSISLNTNDTYQRVIFKNKSMFIGENTADDYGAYNYSEEFTASNTLNVSNKVKEIPMLTMESSRASTLAPLHLDNKFTFKFSCPANDKFLGLNLGDWATVKSNQVLDDTDQAKILITKKSIGETSIGFEGIKFASID